MSSHPQLKKEINRPLSDEDQQFYRKIVSKNKNKQSQSIIQNQIDFTMYKPHIGLLHAIWYSKSNKKLATNIGTGFQISNYLVLTCTHNVYSSRINSYAQTLQFLPQRSIQSNKKPLQANIIKAYLPAKSLQAFIKRDISKVSFEIEPIIEEFCLLKLQKAIDKSQQTLFPTIGNLKRMFFNPNEDKLAVIGYPNTYFSSRNFRDIQTFKQEEFRGQLKSKDNHVFHYTMKTTVGMSGSPIFAIKKNDMRVVGIHTHRGKSTAGKSFHQQSYNSGLYFNEQILKTIQSYLKYYQQQIQFKDIQKKTNKINEQNKQKQQVKKQKIQQVQIEEWEIEDVKEAEFQVEEYEYILQKWQDKRESNSIISSNSSYENRSVLSVSILQNEQFQNTSEISQSEYEWMQLPEMDLLLKKMSFSSCSDDDEYEKQCWCPAVYSDSTDTSFLDYL